VPQQHVKKAIIGNMQYEITCMCDLCTLQHGLGVKGASSTAGFQDSGLPASTWLAHFD
jgi:hypothetical protein